MNLGIYKWSYLNQFMSRDPWGGSMWRPDTLHAYSYVGGNSVNLIDPTGECYGPFRFLRDIESTNCANQDMALSILRSSETTGWQKTGAGVYTAVMGGSHIMLGSGLAMGGYAAGGAAIQASATLIPAAQGFLASHTTLAAALPYAAIGANFVDDGLTAYAAATGDPYAQEQAIMAQQMAMANGGSPFFDGLGGLLGAAKLGRRSLADFIGNCNIPRFFGGGSGGGNLSIVDDWTFVGYHGTSSHNVTSLLEGINPPRTGNFGGYNQLGEGFYTTPDRVSAARFAKFATTSPAEPVVVGIYARKHNFDLMNGIVVERQYWNQPNYDHMPQGYIDNYDMNVAPIAGFEKSGWWQVKFNPRSYENLKALLDD